MILPHEVVRALGGSPMMIRIARDHPASWRAFWNAIERPSWLVGFAIQVGLGPLITRPILDLAEPSIRSALESAEVATRERSVAEAVQWMFGRAQRYSDRLPGLMSGVTSLFLTSEAAGEAGVRELCETIRGVVSADEIAEAFRRSCWSALERPSAPVAYAVLSEPLVDRNVLRVRSTARQRVYVVESWLVVARKSHEVHHPMRLVKRVGPTSTSD